jgi:hypothetical protein
MTGGTKMLRALTEVLLCHTPFQLIPIKTLRNAAECSLVLVLIVQSSQAAFNRQVDSVSNPQSPSTTLTYNQQNGRSTYRLRLLRPG